MAQIGICFFYAPLVAKYINDGDIFAPFALKKIYNYIKMDFNVYLKMLGIVILFSILILVTAILIPFLSFYLLMVGADIIAQYCKHISELERINS